MNMHFLSYFWCANSGFPSEGYCWACQRALILTCSSLQVTAIEPISNDGGASVSTRHLHQSLRWLFGVAAVATDVGHVLLVDLCLDDLSCSQNEVEASGKFLNVNWEVRKCVSFQKPACIPVKTSACWQTTDISDIADCRLQMAVWHCMVLKWWKNGSGLVFLLILRRPLAAHSPLSLWFFPVGCRNFCIWVSAAAGKEAVSVCTIILGSDFLFPVMGQALGGQALGLCFKINLAYQKSCIWVNEYCSLGFQVAYTVVGVVRVSSGLHVPSSSFITRPDKGNCLQWLRFHTVLK